MTCKITKVYETRAGVSVEIDLGEEKTTLLFKKAFWVDTGLAVGSTLKQKDYDKLCELATFCRAFARADTMLAQSDYSVKRLIVRLKHYDFDDDVCRKVADYCVDNKLIDEPSQCERITRFHCIRKHWGKKRIAAELMARGYERSIIFDSLDCVSADEYHNSLMALIDQKYKTPATDRHEEELRIASLARMGFSFDEIRAALNEAAEIYYSVEEIGD